jgi:ribonuclease T1
VRKGIIKLALTGFLLTIALGGAQALQGAGGVPTANIPVGDLPARGVETYQRIRHGGPFPYEKDGVVFGNREHLLPAQKRGYYREYTVETPGAKNRGVQRIVCGGPATTPDACYYTADHYASFRRIVP